jgi:hypothetical protein
LNAGGVAVKCIRMWIGFLVLGLGVVGHAEEGVSRKDLGTKVKLRVLVDKVMQPQAKWVTEEWMVKATAEAGFNVLSPRAGYDRLKEVNQVGQWCRKYGIYYMPWMRGSLESPKGAKADGKRMVWADGREQPLWSPNADEFWAWTRKYVVEYARLAAANPHVMGVFLDYENYAPGRRLNCYSLSYDEQIMKQFGASKGISIPSLEPAKRKGWLEKQGLFDEFSRFQVNHWRKRCRELRQAVDQIDPAFQFCVYPAPGTPFMVQAIYPEWATKRAPLILADASTYGRTIRLGGQAVALEANRQRLLRNMEVPKAAGIPFVYIGGIDPVVRGADPEFSGKNAVMISETTQGYWIFYEGPTYTKPDHAEYWKWFTWANRAISEGRFAVWREPRQGEEDVFSLLTKHAGQARRLIPPTVTGTTVKYPHLVRLRGENVLLLAVRKGQRVEVVLRHHPVGTYESPVRWELRDSRMRTLVSGTVPQGKQGTMSFTPEADGICYVNVTADGCAYSIVQSNVPIGLYAGQGLSLIYGAERLYFQVPEGLERFTISARGAGAETVRLNVYDAEAKELASGQTTRTQDRVKVAVQSAGGGGKVWSLSITRADQGTLEDGQISLDPKLPPVLSLVAEQVFRIGR